MAQDEVLNLYVICSTYYIVFWLASDLKSLHLDSIRISKSIIRIFATSKPCHKIETSWKKVFLAALLLKLSQTITIYPMNTKRTKWCNIAKLFSLSIGSGDIVIRVIITFFWIIFRHTLFCLIRLIQVGFKCTVLQHLLLPLLMSFRLNLCIFDNRSECNLHKQSILKRKHFTNCCLFKILYAR